MRSHPVDSQTPHPQGSSKSERTRGRLVTAIRQEIHESGDFSAASVAARTGSSPANFYNHFATKDAALEAAYDETMADLNAFVTRQCQIERLLDEGIEAFMAGWVSRSAEFFAGNSALFRLAQAVFGRSKSLRDLFRSHEAQVLESYRRFIELGQSANQIRAGNQKVMAQMLLVFSESWHHSLVQKLTPGDALHQELTQGLVRILSVDVLPSTANN